jgi:hypothetical protein
MSFKLNRTPAAELVIIRYGGEINQEENSFDYL